MIQLAGNLESVADESISIVGAREHNLKNISVCIPRDCLVVVTGVSGSGKSTLAFDILFAEGQRRFLDSMNVYARQFVEQLPKPDVDLISGIPPTVSIEQRNSRGGGKSTVATVTEIYHFLRLLFARLGTQYCPECRIPVQAQTADQVGQRLAQEAKKRGDLILLAPVVKNRKGFHTEVAEWAAKHGYEQVRADGKLHATDQTLRLDRFREHDVEIVIGKLPRGTGRRAEGKSVQQLVDDALKIGHGTLYALGVDGRTLVHSTERSCSGCGQSFGPLDPKMFSYNSPQGWCPRCRGFGELFYLPDVDRGARADSIEESWFEWQEGERELCPDCEGTRLHPIARSVRWVNFHPKSTKGMAPAPTIVDFSNATVDALWEALKSAVLKGREAEIGRDILPEIRERLRFLQEVGLGYLQLGRSATTLSGGEAQRIRLAAQLGSNLSGVLYVLDEPTIGLHPRDNEKLLAALKMLKGRGNSLVVVEHDEQTMHEADYVIDLGPGAGTRGGEVIAQGTLKELMAHPESVTAKCLRASKRYPTRGERRSVQLARSKSKKSILGPQTPALVLEGASLHNLKQLTLRFPLQKFICVTGVSGSGKSTLVRNCLLPALKAKLSGVGPERQNLTGVIASGSETIRAVYEVDQAPIGRTPRSVPATYVGFFDEIRELFSQVPEARMRGYSASRFSFNSAHGRCPDCLGAGTVKLEVSFMPTAFVRCETCQGCRFNRETLDVELHGLNIAQVLDLTVAQALDVFGSFPRIKRALQALSDTGLDYVKLGQTSPTLSGGEAQRLKLVTHLLSGFRERKPNLRSSKAKASSDSGQMELPGNAEHPMQSSFFILEEPTIGLHMADVKQLVGVIQRLVDVGNTIVVIEHNLELIAEADWVIDLGPEGGDQGGRIVGEGTPEYIARLAESRTGNYLRRVLQQQS